jgi:hypothetical protein
MVAGFGAPGLAHILQLPTAIKISTTHPRKNSNMQKLSGVHSTNFRAPQTFVECLKNEIAKRTHTALLIPVQAFVGNLEIGSTDSFLSPEGGLTTNGGRFLPLDSNHIFPILQHARPNISLSQH